MTDLTELAKRVEALDGPCRETDAEIALALGIVRERDGDCFYGHRDHSVLVLERDYYDHASVELPAYTGSYDAANTLVPRPAEVAVMDGAFRSEAKVSHRDGLWCVSRAATPSLALCAAALRARAAMGEG